MNSAKKSLQLSRGEIGVENFISPANGVTPGSF